MSSATFCCWQSSNVLSKWIIRQQRWFVGWKASWYHFSVMLEKKSVWICHILSLIERISKQQLLSTNHNDVSLRINSLESSGELTVRLCAAHLLRTSSLMFLLCCFSSFDVSPKQLGKLLWLCSTLHVKKELKSQHKAGTTAPGNP